MVHQRQDRALSVITFGCLLAVSQGRNGRAHSVQHTSQTTCMAYPSLFPMVNRSVPKPGEPNHGVSHLAFRSPC